MDNNEFTNENLDELIPDSLEEELSRLSELLDFDLDDGDSKENEIAVDIDKKTEEDAFKYRKDTYVRVSDDLRTAWLFLEVPTRREYTVDRLLDLLKANNVNAGFIMSNIKAMVKKGVYERAIKVAEAKDPIEGHDGYFDYGFDVEAVNRKNPKILPDGSVDYRSMNLLVTVGKDQLIAKYNPCVQGENGYLVDGTPLPFKAVKDLPPMKGKGFNYDDEKKEYYAKFDGNIDFKQDSYLEVRNVYQIDGDVNQLTGPIEFQGDVHILGNVEAGAKIKAGKTVTIDGVVEAAEIIAGGDIVLKRGIQGSNEGLLVSGGTVYSNFIDHTTVRAAMDLNTNTILNSQVFVNGKVVVNGKKGKIVGGYTHARCGMKMTTLGNDAEVKTHVHIGLEEKDFEKNQTLMKRERQLREALTPVVSELTHLVKKSKTVKLSPKEVADFRKLSKEKDNLSEKLNVCIEEKAKIDRIISQSSDAKIVVEENIYKGVVVGCDMQNLVIKDNTMCMIYSKNHGTIETSVFVRK